MKKPKSEAVRAKKPATEKLATEKVNTDFLQRIRSGRYYNWGIKPRKSSFVLPTPEQLATLAAALGRTSQDDHQKLCSSALNLWFTSIEAVELQKQCNEDYRLLAAETEAWKKQLPQPKDSDFPMKLDNALKRIFHKIQNTGKRAEIFKGWLSYVICGERQQAATAAGSDLSSLGTPTKQDVTERYTAARKEQIDKPQFNHLCNAILGWRAKYHAETISNVRRTVRLNAIAKIKAEREAVKAASEKKLKKKL